MAEPTSIPFMRRPDSDLRRIGHEWQTSVGVVAGKTHCHAHSRGALGYFARTYLEFRAIEVQIRDTQFGVVSH